jgi:hypothetical protein
MTKPASAGIANSSENNNLKLVVSKLTTYTCSACRSIKILGVLQKESLTRMQHKHVSLAARPARQFSRHI